MQDKLSVPVIVAPMFLVSYPELVIAASKNGVVGSFPLANARTGEILEQWFRQIKEALPSEPWAVNLVSHFRNKRFTEDVELIRQYEPPIVITSLGHPGKVIEVVHSYGGLVYSDVTTLKHAKKAADSGVDGLILVCSGAGGHGGSLNPFAFISAVKEFWRGTIILAGGISHGKDVFAARLLGADFAYMGTRFIAAEESSAPGQYKEMLVSSTIDDIFYTDALSGIKANYLIPSLEKAGIDIKSLKPGGIFNFKQLGDVTLWRDLWSAGHGVSAVHKVEPIAEIIEQLIREYEEAKRFVLTKSSSRD